MENKSGVLIMILAANNGLKKLETWRFCVINTFLKHTQSARGHRRPDCGETRATHAVGLFCFGEERRKLSPRGEVLDDSNLSPNRGKQEPDSAEGGHLGLTACRLPGDLFNYFTP